ncbi:type II secretion system protein GspJ [Sphingosinithalassobacter sp. CS137]|uniref:type II secretion system protein GspJ n=1 Tax=Sphingosinithalassobacter sp. CS137 TaxID=2762748 RepID=UPI0021D0A658|nr:type II secretion system protein GspJ [Sphingosinithalassobacter sp. CS137]
MTRAPSGAAGEHGFTLLELMISLALFALIAVAGLALVQSIMGVQGRTEARLDRVQQLQRSMYVLTSDFDQIARGRLSGEGAGISFTRAAPGLGGPPVPMRYDASGGALVRSIGPVPQLLLPGVTAARWRFWNGEWVDRWPADDTQPDAWPRAVEVEMQVATPGGPGGVLRRVIVLPERPEEPAA